eukprot:2025428-Alexandrium_andersonii.AAC.1
MGPPVLRAARGPVWGLLKRCGRTPTRRASRCKAHAGNWSDSSWAVCRPAARRPCPSLPWDLLC